MRPDGEASTESEADEMKMKARRPNGLATQPSNQDTQSNGQATQLNGQATPSSNQATQPTTPSGEGMKKRWTRNFLALPFNPRLKERAKALRKAGNRAEILLWLQLKKGQFMGLDFDRQKIIGNFIADFYCAEKQVVVEVDGRSHDFKADYDARRDAFLEGLGLRVIHITAAEVQCDVRGVLDGLRRHPAFADGSAGRDPR